MSFCDAVIMSHIAKVHFSKAYDEEEHQDLKKEIEANLIDGTLLLPIFPYPKMKFGLLDGQVISIVDVLPLQKKVNEILPDCIIYI